jgi:hypothetical protein
MTRASSWRPTPDQAAIIRKIFEMAASGTSLKKMAAALNKEAVQSPDLTIHRDVVEQHFFAELQRYADSLRRSILPLISSYAN